MGGKKNRVKTEKEKGKAQTNLLLGGLSSGGLSGGGGLLLSSFRRHIV